MKRFQIDFFCDVLAFFLENEVGYVWAATLDEFSEYWSGHKNKSGMVILRRGFQMFAWIDYCDPKTIFMHDGKTIYLPNRLVVPDAD